MWGGGRFFLLKMPGGGGFPGRGGAEGPGGWNWGSFFFGGGLNIFFRGRNVHQEMPQELPYQDGCSLDYQRDFFPKDSAIRKTLRIVNHYGHSDSLWQWV